MSSDTFLVSSYWRGALNIGNMRQFPTLEQAWEYGQGLFDVVGAVPYVKMYLLTEDNEPYGFKSRPCQRKHFDHATRSFIENPNLDSQELMLQKAQKEFEVLKKKLSL